MLKIQRFINELMTSNCYVVYDEDTKRCLVIDPASEKSLKEILFINEHYLQLDYIFLTHEHTDHTWGCNALKRYFPQVKVVCSSICKQNLKKEFQAYFLFYYDNPNYHYTVCNIDLTTEETGEYLDWFGHRVVFVPAPGHSMGSVCVTIDGNLFTGDAVLLSKPYINKRNGSKALFYESVKNIVRMFSGKTKVFPGHGESFLLEEYKDYIYSI